ncbi:MAG TPA: N-acetylmuramoyl-L-alanine amidase [Bradyrhizobium sp.]|nr:N-acetylmuramoyl-L-alanine amidase [Bradyrhizobium sp.]
MPDDIDSICTVNSATLTSNQERQHSPNPPLTRRKILAGLLGVAAPGVVGGQAIAAQRTPPLVMLDPGHGGHDPGAIGISGLYEKHVALDAAYALQHALEQTGRYSVMLTREDDVFVPLDQRRLYAQTNGAHLFVSLHADALTDHAVRGASVYTLAQKATDAQSDELARRENGVDPAVAEEYQNYTPEVANILESLTERETRYFSARLQQRLVSALSDDVLMLHNPARRANFVVLRSFDTPSVLVEMGFMSNEADELLLQSSQHLAHVVAALKSGIETCMTQVIMPSMSG